MYEVTFKNRPFRFVAGPKGATCAFVVIDDLYAAFRSAMPRLGEDACRRLVLDGIRDNAAPHDKARVIIGDEILPTVSVDFVTTMMQGINSLIRKDKAFRKATRGFDQVEALLAGNMGPAARALGYPSLYELLGLEPVMFT